MGTTNYNFTYINENNPIDIAGDTSIFLNEIDNAIDSEFRRAMSEGSVAVPEIDFVGNLPEIVGFFPQGLCYANGYLYALYYPYSESNTPREYVVKINAATLTEVGRITINNNDDHFTRGNSLTWYHTATANELIICGGLGGSSTKNFVRVNLNNFTLETDFVKVGTSNDDMWAGFAYDADNDRGIISYFFSRYAAFGDILNGTFSARGSFDITNGGTEVLQDSYAHNGKFYQAMYHWSPGNDVAGFNTIRCYIPTRNCNYMNVIVPVSGEIQGLARVEDGLMRSDRTGHYLVSFVDGSLYDIKEIPTTNLYTTLAPESSTRYRLNFGTSASNAMGKVNTASVTISGKTITVVTSIPFSSSGRSMLNGKNLVSSFGNTMASCAFDSADGSINVFQWYDTAKNGIIRLGYGNDTATRTLRLRFAGYENTEEGIWNTLPIAANATDDQIKSALTNVFTDYRPTANKTQWIYGTDATALPTDYFLGLDD